MARQSIISILLFALAVLVVSGSNFLTAPILIEVIGPTEFATWAKTEPILLAFLPLAGLGLQVGLLSEYRKSPGVIGAIFPYHVLFSLSIAVVTFILIAIISGNPSLALGTATVCSVEGVIILFIAYWRAAEQPFLYATVEGARALSVVVVTIGLGLYVHGVITGVLDYIVLRAAIGLVFLFLAFIVVQPIWRPDRKLARSAARYGLPIVLSSTAVAIIMNFDRYAIGGGEGGKELASYVAHSKLVQLLGSALSPFFLWFAPIAIRRLQAQETDRTFFSHNFFAFVVMNCAFSLGLWLIAPVLWQLLFPSIALNRALLLVNVVGMAIFACGNPLSVSTLRDGQTSTALIVTVMCAALGMCCVWAGSHIAGTIGVAWGKMIAMGFYSATFAVLTIRSLGIVYHWSRVCMLVAITIWLGWILVDPISSFPPVAAVVLASLASIAVITSGYALYSVASKKG